VILISKLKVAGSIPVARSIFYLQNRRVTKGAMTNINSDREENEQLARLSRQTGLIHRPLALEGVNELFAEIAKYDEDERLETFLYLKQALNATRMAANSEPAYPNSPQS
jgi:hypothetical protein